MKAPQYNVYHLIVPVDFRGTNTRTATALRNNRQYRPGYYSISKLWLIVDVDL